jgi:hypothetical protein
MTASAPSRTSAAMGAGALPRIVGGLAAAAVVLLAVGLAARLTGVRGPLAELLSMDAPGSLSRMFVTGVLASAAVVAALGARWRPGRRAWWTAVAAVAAALALTKGVGTVHSQFVHALGPGVRAWHGMVVLGLLATAGLVGLWRLSGDDRRDRHRLVAVLGAHAFAAVGLAAVSTYVKIWAGETAYAGATFVEETAEALTAVGLLAVVLLGVLPRLVLPEGSLLRRRDDDVPQQLQAAAAGAPPAGLRLSR